MDHVKTILVATDHTEHARRAELRAGMLGDELSAETLEVISARPARAEPGTAARLHGSGALRRESPTARPAPSRCEIGTSNVRALWTGPAPAVIADRADDIGADLTIVAGKRPSFLADLVARFRHDELIRLSDRPVLLVNREPETAYRKVLVGVDFSAESMQAARMALALAPTAQFTFLHVFRIADEDMMREQEVPLDAIHACRTRARETARRKLNGFIETLGPRRQLVSRAIEHGMPAPMIHAHAGRIHADLIAVGKHGKSRFVELFLGSVTQRLIEYGACDLLVNTSPHAEDPDLPPAA